MEVKKVLRSWGKQKRDQNILCEKISFSKRNLSSLLKQFVSQKNKQKHEFYVQSERVYGETDKVLLVIRCNHQHEK